MTSVLAPSYAAAEQYGALLRQLGATKLDHGDPYELRITYFNNERAVNASAVLRDTVDGARLVVENRSMTADFHTPTVDGVARLLHGVPGVETSVGIPRGGRGLDLYVTSPDQRTVDGLRALLVDQTRLGEQLVKVAVVQKPAGELPVPPR